MIAPLVTIISEKEKNSQHRHAEAVVESEKRLYIS
jgi:hypothetical protein